MLFRSCLQDYVLCMLGCSNTVFCTCTHTHTHTHMLVCAYDKTYLSVLHLSRRPAQESKSEEEVAHTDRLGHIYLTFHNFE